MPIGLVSYGEWLQLQASSTANNTTQATADGPPDPSPGAYYATLACLYTFSLVGLVGHSLVLAAFLLEKSLRTRTANIFIFSLSCMNLILVVMEFMPLISSHMNTGWPFSYRFCLVNVGLATIMFGGATWHMMFVALDHYIFITRNARYPKIVTKKVVALWLVLAWLMPLSIIVAYLAFLTGQVDVQLVDGEAIYLAHLFRCTLSHNLIFDTLATITWLAVPVLVISVAYLKLFIYVRHSCQRVEAHRTSSRCSRKKKGRILKMGRGEKQLLKMVAIIMLLIIAGYSMVPTLRRLDPTWQLTDAWLLTYALYLSTTTTIPVIYGLMNRQFQGAFRALLRCRLTLRQGSLVLAHAHRPANQPPHSRNTVSVAIHEDTSSQTSSSHGHGNGTSLAAVNNQTTTPHGTSLATITQVAATVTSLAAITNQATTHGTSLAALTNQASSHGTSLATITQCHQGAAE